MKEYNRALIVAEPWISKILSGEKLLEMRSRHTRKTGRIGLIRKGSGLIVGDIWLNGSVEISPENLHLYKGGGHCIDYEENPELIKYNFAWHLERVNEYYHQVKYKHPRGAVVWVKVNNEGKCHDQLS